MIQFFIDIKQTLPCKVATEFIKSEKCLFFMHCWIMFISHFFSG